MPKNISHTHHAPLARQALSGNLFTVPPNTIVEVPDDVADGLYASFGDLVTIHDSTTLDNAGGNATGGDADKPAVSATEGAIALAEEHGIDLSKLTGSGKDGKITQPDVAAEVARLEAESNAGGNATGGA